MGLSGNIYKSLGHWPRTFLLNAYALSLNFERYGDKFAHVLSDFFTNERMSLDELHEYQRERLKSLIRHAYDHVPYYHEVMKSLKLRPSDFNDVRDIVKLPILTREDIRQNYNRLKADNVPWYKIRHGHTSGTTGSPLAFLWDTNVCVAHHAADWRQKKWAGLEFGDRFISLQGRQIVPIEQTKPPFWVMNKVHNQLFMSSFHLRDDYLKYYIDKIIEFGPTAIEGYPSSLYILARYMVNHDIKIPVPAILSSSETLLPFQRECIESVFNCRIFDFYGMAERVVYGSECQKHGGKHLNVDYGLTEIVDTNNMPANHGCHGSLVATGLWNYAMPLIRYKTSDVSAISDVTCECGRSFPLMDDITTKAEDIIVLKDGRLIPPSIMTHPFKTLTSVSMSQIVQEDHDHVKVYLKKTDSFTNDEYTELYKGMRERLGNDVKIEIIFAPELGKNISGKFRWVISKVHMPESKKNSSYAKTP